MITRNYNLSSTQPVNINMVMSTLASAHYLSQVDNMFYPPPRNGYL